VSIQENFLHPEILYFFQNWKCSHIFNGIFMVKYSYKSLTLIASREHSENFIGKNSFVVIHQE
jgi:hypothetical protein